MKPHPQGAFPWLWRWDFKAREKSPADEVGESSFNWRWLANLSGRVQKKRYFPLIVMCLLRFCPMF